MAHSLSATEPPAATGSSATPEPAWRKRRLHLPPRDFAILEEPPLASAVGVAEHNSATLGSLETPLQGRSLRLMRQWSRDEVLRSAAEYTS
jgi:hypothetical protein